MTLNDIPKIYNIRAPPNMNERFITCYFKLVYTTHTKTYKISASHTIEDFINKMKMYISNDLYFQLIDVNNFDFVCVGHYSIHGVASEQGPPLVSTPHYILNSLVNSNENSSDDPYLAFYIRPCNEENTIINNT